MGEVVQLLRYTNDASGKKLELVTDALQYVRDRFREPLHIVASAGKLRVGKSTFNNMFVITSNEPVEPNAHLFKAAAQVRTLTKGVWLYNRGIPHPDGGSTMLLDCEGMEGNDEAITSKLYLFCMLLSSLFCVHVTKTFDHTAVNQLAMAVKIAKDDVPNGEELMPALAVVIRDCNAFVVEEGDKETDGDGMMEFFLRMEGSEALRHAQNQISTLFKRRTCVRVSEPPTEFIRHSNVQLLDKTSAFYTSFLDARNELLRRAESKLLPHGTTDITIDEWIGLCGDVVEIINSGALGEFPSLFEGYLERRCRSVVKEGMDVFNSTFDERTVAVRYTIKEEALTALLEDLVKTCRQALLDELDVIGAIDSINEVCKHEYEQFLSTATSEKRNEILVAQSLAQQLMRKLVDDFKVKFRNALLPVMVVADATETTSIKEELARNTCSVFVSELAKLKPMEDSPEPSREDSEALRGDLWETMKRSQEIENEMLVHVGNAERFMADELVRFNHDMDTRFPDNDSLGAVSITAVLEEKARLVEAALDRYDTYLVKDLMAGPRAVSVRHEQLAHKFEALQQAENTVRRRGAQRMCQEALREFLVDFRRNVADFITTATDDELLTFKSRLVDACITSLATEIREKLGESEENIRNICATAKLQMLATRDVENEVNQAKLQERNKQLEEMERALQAQIEASLKLARLRELGATEVQEIVCENQRLDLKSRKWSAQMLVPKSDGYAWSDKTGRFPRDMKTYPLPEGWVWRDNWTIDMTDADENGWQYAYDFSRPGKKYEWSSTRSLLKHWVRRRQWVRWRIVQI